MTRYTGVKTGRVSKSTPKKIIASPIKKEMVTDDENFFGGGAVHTPENDFDMDDGLDNEI